jgi:hypothetical protein
MGTDLKFEFNIEKPTIRPESYQRRMAKLSNEPKLRQYLVLAYQIQEKLDTDPVCTAKQIAAWMGLTPPRICQILDLLLLCPKIQRDILLSERKVLHELGEYSVRKIVVEPIWDKQIGMWHSLLKL